MGRLRLPSPVTGELWQHTCFEIFLGQAGVPAYFEFNFAPDGRWAAYSFASYRDGARATVPAPRIQASLSDDRLDLDATLDLASLELGGRLRIGVSSVLEASDGSLSYWALRHAPGKPDFHHTDCFALELDALRD